MSAKMLKNGNEYPIGVIPQNVIDDVFNLQKIIKKKEITVSTPAPNKVAGIGLTISNAIPIAVECVGTCAFIGSHYQGEWLISFYSYGTGEQEVVTNKTVTVYYIDLTKISVQS